MQGYDAAAAVDAKNRRLEHDGCDGTLYLSPLFLFSLSFLSLLSLKISFWPVNIALTQNTIPAQQRKTNNKTYPLSHSLSLSFLLFLSLTGQDFP